MCLDTIYTSSDSFERYWCMYINSWLHLGESMRYTEHVEFLINIFLCISLCSVIEYITLIFLTFYRNWGSVGLSNLPIYCKFSLYTLHMNVDGTYFRCVSWTNYSLTKFTPLFKMRHDIFLFLWNENVHAPINRLDMIVSFYST